MSWSLLSLGGGYMELFLLSSLLLQMLAIFHKKGFFK